jgi:hypothetical protein
VKASQPRDAARCADGGADAGAKVATDMGASLRLDRDGTALSNAASALTLH